MSEVESAVTDATDEVLNIQKRLSSLEASVGGMLGRRLIRLFWDLTEERVARIKQCRSTGDLERVQKDLHDLKSAALNIGARALAGLYAQLEEAITCDSTDRFTELFARSERLFRNVKARIET